MKSVRLLLNASYPRNRMFEKIDNIALICRPSQYARGKCSEPTRPSLKTRGKIEAVSITQQRGRHRDSQRVGSVWFIANTVRNDDRPVASRFRIDFPKHIVPGVN